MQKVFKKNKVFNLRFRFRFNKLQINLDHSVFKHNYLSLTPGLLIKGFDYKKSLKRSLSLKLLLIRFLRKVLITLGIKNLYLMLKGTPVKLSRFIHALFKPIPHIFLNPLKEAVYDEVTHEAFPFKIEGATFTKTLLFGKHKLKKKGRVKRKILRKLILKNNVSD